MLTHLIQYCIESTLYLLSFIVIYRMFLSNLTHFNWMRIYLLGGLALGLILPLISFPVSWHHFMPGAGSIDQPLPTPFFFPKTSFPSQPHTGVEIPHNSSLTREYIWGIGLSLIYFTVFIYRLNLFIRKLLSIRNDILHHPKEKQGKYWIMHTESPSPAYSFFNYIFLGRKIRSMDTGQIEGIVSHEITHARQFHTADILILEVLTVIFWFNPLFHIYKIRLQEVHEYSADHHILKNNTMKQAYSRLLLRLTANEHAPDLSSAFSATLISRRIRMIQKTSSHPRYRILFLLLLPVAAGLLMSFSYLEARSNATPSTLVQQTITTASAGQIEVGRITWIDNMLYTDEQLGQKLGIKSGDTYSRDLLNNRLWMDEDAVCSMYLDNGYLFFNAEAEEHPGEDGTMDLSITIYEGIQVKVRKINITGNGNVPEEVIMEKIQNRPGELFSRIKIIRSVRAIGMMEQFEPEDIEVNPTPFKDPDTGASAGVDIEFRLSKD
ncbi:MAG: M56 family metallopeptidase [Bacteroidales bacterium]